MVPELPPHTPKKLGSIILCGGQSRRMGVSKAELPFGGGPMIEPILATVTELTEFCVVVGRLNESLRRQLADRFGRQVEWAEDRHINCGPMEGIRVGLQALRGRASAAFVSSCDVPLLHPEWVRWLFSKLGAYDAVIPVEEQRVYGLTAVYRTRLADTVAQWVLDRRLRVSNLVQLPNVLKIPLDELRTFDPELESLINVNNPDDYRALLRRQAIDEDPTLFRTR